MNLEDKIKSLLESVKAEEANAPQETADLLEDKQDAAIDADIEQMNESFKITPFVAKTILDNHGGADKNFYTLPSSTVSSLLDAAKEHGYRKRPDAPGSTARMFHQHLVRLATKAPQTQEANAPTKTNEDKQKAMSAHVNALSEGETLSEEFKLKAATILEAAINEGVAKEVERLTEEHAQKLNEAVESVQADLVKNVEGFMNLVVREWTLENQVAIESGMKIEMLENFVDGIKGLFEKANVTVPEGKRDLLGEQETKIAELTTKLDEQSLALENMTNAINEEKAGRIIESVGKTLTMTDLEKFNSLCENVEFVNAEDFETKVKTIKDSYFPKTKIVTESLDTAPAKLDEGVMSHYVAALSNPLTFNR